MNYKISNGNRNCRPEVAGVIREFVRFCNEQQVPISRLALELNYARVAKLFNGRTTTVHEATLEKIQTWLREEKRRINYRVPDTNRPVLTLAHSTPAPPSAKGFEVTLPMDDHDAELSLIYSLLQVMNEFRDITTDAERDRAMQYISAREYSGTEEGVA